MISHVSDSDKDFLLDIQKKLVLKIKMEIKMINQESDRDNNYFFTKLRKEVCYNHEETFTMRKRKLEERPNLMTMSE